jgi:hypothetical protein
MQDKYISIAIFFDLVALACVVYGTYMLSRDFLHNARCTAGAQAAARKRKQKEIPRSAECAKRGRLTANTAT